MSEKIAFITYESPFAQCGGIAAVMGRLPGHVQKASGLDVVVITPFHHRIPATAALKQFAVDAGTVCVNRSEVKIHRYTEWSHIGKLQHPDCLLTHLQNREDPFAGFLREQFPEDIRQRLERSCGQESDPSLIRAVTAQLDLLLQGPPLYEEWLVPGKIRGEYSGITDRAQLNYAVLHEFYPYCIPDVRPWPWYFLEARSDKEQNFFAGHPHPYILDEDRRLNAQQLLRDSLFFGMAAARALPVIDPCAEWILFMQDWEAATTVFALKGNSGKYRLFLTLHNSYDSRVKEEDIRTLVKDSASFPGSTILSCVIPHVERPVLTVSEQFACDLISDLLQERIMADHLQAFLKSGGFAGVDNGPFEKLHVDNDILEEACRGAFDKLREWKAGFRQTALASFGKITHSPENRVWGDLQKFNSTGETCWFVMAGRDDTRQKGYDVAAVAAKRFLQGGEKACFLFFPIPGDEGLAGLAFLEKLAEEFPCYVAVFPFRWQEGYFAALRGATFGLMPSFYEPFGSVNEFYLNGTAGIGRATGGLQQQIVPLRAAASFSRAVNSRIQKWHSLSAGPTGLLYREQDNIASAAADWEKINRAEYDPAENSFDRIEQRMRLAVYRAMVKELCLCFKDAVQIYHHRPQLYYRMISDGITHVSNSFSWERAAQEYVRCLSDRQAAVR